MKKSIIHTIIISNCLLFLVHQSFAQNIGINGTGGLAHSSALLDVDAVATPSLGILIPRIALQAINLATPIASPATSLLLYNTATASTGTNAVSPGYYYWDGAKWVRFNTGASNNWSLIGNAGTTAGTNFLGTTDGQDLIFKQNGAQAGLLNSSLNNTSFGVNALNPSTTGMWNIAIGNQSMQNMTTGNMNVGVGYTTLSANTTGFGNSALGQNALRANTTGYFNTAIGEQAMFANISGQYNSVLGSRAFISNTSGNNNTAVGWGSLHDNITGNNNTALGYYSAFSTTTGSLNVAIGNNAAITNTTGSYNTLVGAQADVVTNNLTNASAIGYNAKVSSSNAMVLGNGLINVGIGFTNPFYPLDVTGANPQFTGAFNNTNANGTGVFAGGQGGGGYYLPSGSGAAISGYESGIVGDAASTTGTGIRMIGNGLTTYQTLISGSGGAFGGTSAGVYGIATATAVNIAGGYFTNGNGDYAFVGYRTSGNVSQKINGTGAVSTIVKNTKNELVNLYCPEAPEVLFQDFGKGTLLNGEAKITLDETFTKNVRINDKHPLRVIIQLEGDCKGVYVTNKTNTSFLVKELQGGNSNVAFTYFVTANRADAYNEDGTLFSKFEDVRYGEAPAKAVTKNEPKVAVEKK